MRGREARKFMIDGENSENYYSNNYGLKHI